MAATGPLTLPRRRRVAVILAAGRGTRLRSAIPKVLHRAAGRPLLAWVIRAAREAACEEILVVAGHGAAEVRRAMEERGEEGLGWVIQEPQRGTGDALAQAAETIQGPATLLVLSGDAPLVSGETLEALLARAEGGWGALAVAELPEPGELGRVIPGREMTLERIVEAADATPEELALRWVNAGIYALPAPEIVPYLQALRPDNVKGELYLTDALTAAARNREIRLVRLADPREALGVNTRQDLARVHRALLERHMEDLMASGVTLLAPEQTVVEPGVQVGQDTVIEAQVTLLGETVVGAGCRLGQGAWLRDARLGEGVEVEPYSVLDGAQVGDGCRVGPFARLRPGAVLQPGARVGNFVEVKNSRLGPGVKANHLAYLGDATVGEGTNVGAGVITCNYDGARKHPTEIGRQVFLGSDTMLVAPVTVGDEATTAAGSVITKDVPAKALGVSRAPQRNVPGWARRRSTKKESE